MTIQAKMSCPPTIDRSCSAYGGIEPIERDPFESQLRTPIQVSGVAFIAWVICWTICLKSFMKTSGAAVLPLSEGGVRDVIR